MFGDSGERTQSLFCALQLRQHSLAGRPVQRGCAIAVARGAIGAGTGGSETFPGARTSRGRAERGGATVSDAGSGHGPDGLGLPLLAGSVIRTGREYACRADGVSAGAAFEPG